MKNRLLLAVLLLAPFTARAQGLTFSNDLVVRCRIGSAIKINAPMGNLADTDEVIMELPEVGVLVAKSSTPGFETTYRFGLGKTSLEREVRVMDRDGRTVVKPLKINLQITKEGLERKRLQMAFESYNPFTDRLEAQQIDLHGLEVMHSLLYTENLHTRENAKDMPLGTNIQNYIFCNFQEHL